MPPRAVQFDSAVGQKLLAGLGGSWLASWSSWIVQLWLLQDGWSPIGHIPFHEPMPQSTHSTLTQMRSANTRQQLKKLVASLVDSQRHQKWNITFTSPVTSPDYAYQGILLVKFHVTYAHTTVTCWWPFQVPAI